MQTWKNRVRDGSAGDLRWAGVRLERFVRKRPSEPIESDKPGAQNAYVSGVFGGNAKLTGRGNSAAAKS